MSQSLNWQEVTVIVAEGLNAVRPKCKSLKEIQSYQSPRCASPMRWTLIREQLSHVILCSFSVGFRDNISLVQSSLLLFRKEYRVTAL